MDVPLTVTLFGPVRVLIEGEPMPHVRSRKALWLLALLILRDGRPAAREWVASALWPDAEGGVALANLRPIVSELRRALGSQGERVQSPDRISLVFDLEGAEVDVVRFDRAVKRGDPQQAVEVYAGALLEGCPEEWAHQERNVREAECLTALEALAKSALDDADHARAIALFTRAAGLDPWRDAPRRGLMTTLAASGDVNAALQIYRDFAQLLGSEIGTAPDRETTALYERFRADLRRSPKRAETARPTPNNLFKPLTELVGREDECLDIAARIRRSRLVTLTGMGGIGKTRLALATASNLLLEHSGGVWFVALDTLTDGRAVPQAIAETLGLREEPGKPLLAKIADRLRQGLGLLVLDNCEHLLDAVARVASEFLRECPDLHILATSREPMGVLGEAVWPVPTLAFPDAASLPAGGATRLRVAQGYESVRLFVERAQAVCPDFELDADSLPAVVDVCARVEGIPLAIELAAARVRSMPVNQVAERLKDHLLETLQGNVRAAVDRQQALGATLDWSYNLLSVTERAALRHLSVFAGGWTLRAAEEVLEEGKASGAARLESLVDKSLIVFDRPRGRYRYLETVRSYAARRLDDAGEKTAAVLRHREWCRGLIDEAKSDLNERTQSRWFARIDPEFDNVRVALDALEETPAEGLKLALAVGHYWQSKGFPREGLRYLDLFQKSGDKLPSEDRVGAIRRESALRGQLGEYEICDALDLETIEIYRKLDRPHDLAMTLYMVGVRALICGDHGRAEAYLDEGLRVCRNVDSPFLHAHILNNLAWNRQLMGDYVEARAGHEESLRLFRAADDLKGVGWAQRALGNLAQAQGDYETARTLHEECLTSLFEQDDLAPMAWSWDSLGRIAIDLGHRETAERMLGQSLGVFRERTDAKGTASALAALGNVALSKGDPAGASRLLDESLGICGRTGAKPGMVEALLALGEVSLHQNDLRTAMTRFREALGLCQRMGSRRASADAIQSFAPTLAASGHTEDAVRLWSAADALRTAIGAGLPPVKLVPHAQALDRARAALSHDSFEAAWAEGQNWSAEMALARAIGSLPAGRQATD